MYLDKFVHSSTGKIVMSVLLGIGLASLFRAVCKGKNCRIIAAPPMEEIDNQTYNFDGKCYKLEKHAVKCNNKKQIIPIGANFA
jgi:hypothetical protein